MKRVLLVTAYEPHGDPGTTENAYGIPFTVVESGEEDDKGRPIKCFVAELEDEIALPMIDAGRVIDIDADDETDAEAVAFAAKLEADALAAKIKADADAADAQAKAKK